VAGQPKGAAVTRVWLPAGADAFGGLPAGLEADLWTGGEDLPDSAGQVEFVVVPMDTPPPALRKLGTLPRLKTIQLVTAGADAVLPYVPAGVTVCNVRGAHSAGTAEWTVGAIVASLREFPRFAVAQHDGRWDPGPTEPVNGKHVLIVGYGDIGAAVERRLAGWEVTVDRVARRARDGVHPVSELPDLLPAADVVVILLPVTDETKQLVNKEFLSSMKDGALLVNVARGVIVDTDALLAELTSGRLRAALDVTDPEPLPAGHPLWRAPGLLLTPHVGGKLVDADARAYRVVGEQLRRVAAGEPLRNVIGDRGY
jgi:phosphoglycerate dehydrogenase-like enzyme